MGLLYGLMHPSVHFVPTKSYLLEQLEPLCVGKKRKTRLIRFGSGGSKYTARTANWRRWCSNSVRSNCLLYGNEQKAKSEMLCCGEMRYEGKGFKHGRRRLMNTKQIEYLVVTLDEQQNKVQLSLRQADILEALAKDEKLKQQGGCVPELQIVSK